MGNLIKMKITERGSENGVNIHIYEKGTIYQVDDGLKKAFVDDLDWAETVKKGKPQIPVRDPGDHKPGEPFDDEGSGPPERTVETEIETGKPDEKETGVEGPKETGVEGGIGSQEGGTAEGGKDDIPDIILRSNDKPFKTAPAAKGILKRMGIIETHEVVSVKGGFQLKRRIAQRNWGD